MFVILYQMKAVTGHAKVIDCSHLLLPRTPAASILSELLKLCAVLTPRKVWPAISDQVNTDTENL